MEKLRARLAKLEQVSRKRAEHKSPDEELDKAWYEWEKTFDATKDSMMVIDSKSKIIQANLATSRLLGIPVEQIIGKTCWQVVHGADKPPKECPLKKAQFSKNHEEAELYVPEKGVWLDVSTDPILDEQDNINRTVHILRDITDRKIVEQKLKVSEERYKRQFEEALDAIILIDAQTGIIIDCNHATTKLVGKSKSEIVGNPPEILHPPDSNGKIGRAFRQRIKENNGKILEAPIITKSGEIRTAAIKANILDLGDKQVVQAIFRDVTEQKKAQDALQESEKRFRELSNLLPEVVFETDITGGLNFVNNVAFERFGYSRADLDKGLNAFQMMIPEDRSRAKTDIANALSGKAEGPAEYTGLRKDGSTFPIIIHSSPVLRGNVPVGLRGIIVDITERKKAEDELRNSEKRFRELSELLPEIVYEMDLTGKLTFLNQAAFAQFGFSRADFDKGLNAFQTLIPEDRTRAKKDAEKVSRGTDIGFVEYNALRKDGSSFPIIVHSTSIIHENKPVGIRGIIADITERKKTEDVLKASEKRFRSTLDNMLEGCQIIDYDWRYKYINDTAAKHAHLSKKKLLGKTMMEVYPGIEKAKLFSVLRNCMKKRVPAQLENEFSYTNGEKAWFELSIEPIPEGLFILSIDITDRKEITKALRQEREMLEMVTANINAGLSVISKDYHVLWANKVLKSRLGGEKLEGALCYSALNRRKSICSHCGVREIFETGKDLVVHVQKVDTPVGPVWIELTAAAIRDEKGEIVAASEMGLDITERKKLENDLKESLQRFRTIFEGSTDGILASDPKTGKLVFANPKVCELLGYSLAELLKLRMPNLHRKEDLPVVLEQFQEQKSGKLTQLRDVPFLRKDKTVVYCDLNSRLLKIGNEQYMIGFFRDATDRRTAEKEIKALAKFPSENPTPVLRVAKDGSIIYTNKAAQKIMDKLKRKKKPFVTDLLDQSIRSSLSSGLTEKVEAKYVDQVFSFVVAPIPEEGYVNIYGRDVTERKKFEDTLRESEEKFRTIFEGATNGIVGINIETNEYVFANSRMCEITGYSSDELLKLTVPDLHRKEDFPFVLEQFTKQVNEKVPISRNIPFLRKDKTIVYCDTSSSLLKIGNEQYVVGFVRDVTEQKKAEEALKASEEKYRALVDGMSDTAIVLDFDGKIIDVNKTAVELLGYSREELLSFGIQKIEKTLTPEQIKSIFKKMKTDEITVFETNQTTKDGNQLPIEVSATRVMYQGKEAIFSLGRDITERKKAEAALRESEKKYREIINAMNDTVWVISFDGNLIDVNDAAVDVMGYSKEELLAMGLAGIDFDMDPEEIKSNIERMPSDKSQVFETFHTTKSGKKIPVEISSSLVNYQGKDAILSIARDITERKKAEKALIDSEEKYRTMINTMTDTVWVIGFDAKNIDVNDAAVDVLGYSREELLNMGPQDFDELFTKEQIIGLLKKVKAEGRMVFEAQHTTKSGKKFPVEISTGPVNYKGKDAILSIARDITDWKKAEAALKASEEKYREIINAMNDTAWVLDFNGNFIDVNDAAVDVMGYSREELLGMGPAKVDTGLTPEQIDDLFQKVKAVGKMVFETTHTSKDGKAIPVEISSSLVSYQGSDAVLSIARDITDRKKAEEVIEEAMSLLKQSNQELESYTYVVSHDLKAPLRSIKSFGSFLLEDYSDKLDETGQDYLNRMINASSRMDTLIEDLLILSRVGRKYTEFEKVDLNHLLKEILEDLDARIKERNVNVVVDKLPVLSVQRVWLRQLFMNLINNALKFNEAQTPKIEVLYQERDNDHLFRVRDNGIGIEEKYLERIFDLFERAPTEKKYDGTGAGLAICKKIVEQLGGKIWVESAPGKGSTFFFTISKEIKK